MRAVNVKTMSYPGFPTDLQPQIATLLAVCNGTSVLTENVWENRYQYMGELRKLGADVEINGRVATIHGIKHFSGAEVSATDLRAGAAMILAALAAEGETIIDGVRYIDRGYEDVEKNSEPWRGYRPYPRRAVKREQESLGASSEAYFMKNTKEKR